MDSIPLHTSEKSPLLAKEKPEVNPAKPSVKNKTFLETFATCSGSLTKLSTGMMVAWSSPSLPQLMGPDSPIPVTFAEGGWVAAAMQIGSFFSVFLMAGTVDVIGRKWSILCSAIPVFISWFIISEATNINALLFARLLGGIGGGYGKIVIGTYIGEIADPKHRGSLGTIMAIVYNVGIIFVYVVGPLVSIRTFAIISMTVPVALMVTFIWMPETPYYYFMKGKTEEARRTLVLLRGHNVIDKEYDRIHNSVDSNPKFWPSFKLLFTQKESRQAFIIISILFMSIQLTGKGAIMSYTHMIFQSAGGNFSVYISSIITSLVQLAGLIVSSFVIDHSGYRPLLIGSSIGCGTSLGALALFFFVKDELNFSTTYIQWIPLTSLIVYNFVFSIGLNNIPFIMVGELFHTNVKAVAVFITSLILPLTAMTMIKFYQIVVDQVGTYMIFVFFTGAAILSTVLCIFYVPETKGKSLEEIQEELRKS